MKHICVSMDRRERVLESYLMRVFEGELIDKKSCKTVRFPETEIKLKGWNIKTFKNFCDATSSHKNLRIYKAKLAQKL